MSPSDYRVCYASPVTVAPDIRVRSLPVLVAPLNPRRAPVEPKDPAEQADVTPPIRLDLWGLPVPPPWAPAEDQELGITTTEDEWE